MDTLFAAEQPILERLRSTLPECRQVQGARELNGITARTGATPALHLIFDGHEPLLHAAGEQALEQRWLVVVTIRNLREAEGGDGERAEAGPLLLRVCRALIGWSPSPEHGPLRLITTPGARFVPGAALFPLRFATRIVTGGS
ncbi:MAG: hypothetical protein HQM00_01395 [Magnetococcales bacterium]|nr:hypothetical protein [Magnetococcales bacterium]